MPQVFQGPKSDAEKIADRLKPSAGSPDTGTTQITQGSSPNRTITTVHRGATQLQHGPDAPTAPGITGEPRSFLGDKR